jgi:hypothetical protein
LLLLLLVDPETRLPWLLAEFNILLLLAFSYAGESPKNKLFMWVF